MSPLWDLPPDTCVWLLVAALSGFCLVRPSCDGLLEIPVSSAVFLGAVLPHGDIDFENMPKQREPSELPLIYLHAQDFLGYLSKFYDIGAHCRFDDYDNTK